jgi:cell division protein FtsN
VPPAIRPDVRSAPPPASAPAAIPSPDAAAPPTAAPSTTAPGSPATAGGAARQQFEIVVASFRTEERAAAVAAAVSTLALPVRRQVINGWQQVIAGPFASRAEAEQAQQRLAGAGLTETVVRQNQTARG